MKEYQGEKAIISLTSWKARINTVGKTIYSLIKNCPGFHIVLCLSEEEFPKKEKELPKDLLLLGKYFEILWVYKNYKSFKKVLFTMDKYRDVPVISADDDCLYTCNYAEILYTAWCKHKKCVITSQGGKYENYQWGRGPNTLYPPNFRPNANDICDSYFNAKLEFIEDDIVLGIIRMKLRIDIIDLNSKPFYVFHDEILPQSKQLSKSKNASEANKLKIQKIITSINFHF